MRAPRSGFGTLLGTELSLQYRNGLYVIYLILTIFFLTAIALVPAHSREAALGIVILLDPAFIGFYFAGAFVLLEREQGILPVVATTAGSFRSYARPKIAALLILAGTVAAVLLTASTLAGFVRPSVAGVARLGLGLLLAIPVFFNLGVVVAAWKPRVLEYFVYASFVLLPLMIPLAELFGVSGPVGIVGKISPVWGAMVLITSVFDGAGEALVVAGAVAVLLVWNLITSRWAARAFRTLAAGGDRRTGAGTAAVAAAAAKVRERRPGLTRLSRSAVDRRLMLRDPVILALLAAPLLAAFVLGRVLPYLAPLFFQPYLDNIRSFALLLGIILYGVVGSFLILDEKDGGVIPFLKTVPGRPGWYILRRGWMLLIIYLAVLGPTIVAGDLYHGTPVRFLLSLLVDITVLPVVYLAIAIIAQNKVQGLAATKIINILSLPPLLMIAVPLRWSWSLGLFPSAWGSLIRLHAATTGQVLAAVMAGLLYSGAITLLLYQQTRRFTGKPG